MNKLKLNEAQYRFLKTLVESTKEIGEKEVEERRKATHLPFAEGPFIVAAFEIKFSDDFGKKDEQIGILEKALNHLLGENGLCGFVFSNSHENYWMVLEECQHLDTKLAEIKQRILSKYGLDSYVGIGRSVDGLQRLFVSAAEAQEVLQYRNSFENNGIININDIVHFAYRSRIGSNQAYQKVINSFIVGDMDQMETELNTLVEEIRYTPQVSKSSIRRVMIELTVNILNIASNMNVDVDEILSGTDPYSWIISQSHTEIITAWFMELSEKLVSKISEQRQKGEISIVQQVCRYIDDNISDCSLGLASTSDYIKLTSPYLSQLFKKEMKIGINAYITDRRMEKAKYLLKNTQMKIDEIAQKTGYNSSSYFNQVFKKETGKTPTQYREN